MRLAHLALLLLASTAVRAAAPQAAGFSVANVTEASQSHGGFACPVDLDVRHNSGLAQALPAGDLVRRPAAQQLSLTISNLGARAIQSLDAIVQTVPGKAHLQNLSSGGVDTPGERLNMHLDQAIAAMRVADLDWAVASSNAIQYVELRQVTYQDGSSWTAPRSGSCRFTPNPIMLVNTH